MKNKFQKYYFFKKKNGKIVGINNNAFKLENEAFLKFKELFDINYGKITENDNLISIHTGGWFDNEELIYEFKQTFWWFKNHRITAKGGHYYFNTNTAGKEWKIIEF